ncbi:MAG: mechanosensitive ion channel family protein [Gemmatimonadetes bacterium]|nr:mechanosensitive ion channel family protein [Gemmatimonadota bacterium]
MRELLQTPPEWIQTVPWQWIIALLVIAAAYALYRMAAHKIGTQVEDAEKRHRYRKRVGYAIAVLVFVVLGIAFFQKIREMGTLLGFISAGLAIALREYLASFFAWFYLLGQRNISLGGRIEVSGVRGDVIDIGVFKLTLVEVRGEGLGDQSSGRLVTVPNYKILIDPVFHFTAGSPFVWDEIEFTVTFESDWERAKAILEESGRAIVEPHHADIERGFRTIESSYAFRHGVTTPIVYTSIGPSGIVLRLRYLSHVRQRRDNRDAISRHVLGEFRGAGPEIEIAYPTSRTYRSEIDVQRIGEKPLGHPSI